MRAPVIHTPAQVKTVLDMVRKEDLDLCRFLAIRYFAGLRRSVGTTSNPLLTGLRGLDLSP